VPLSFATVMKCSVAGPPTRTCEEGVGQPWRGDMLEMGIILRRVLLFSAKNLFVAARLAKSMDEEYGLRLRSGPDQLISNANIPRSLSRPRQFRVTSTNRILRRLA
jgi:hypothetical protein